MSENPEIPRDIPRQDASQPNIVIPSSSYKGIIPDPASLANYETIQPGLADRIMKLAETSMAHEIKMSEMIAPAQITIMQNSPAAVKRGQWFAGIISLVAIIGAVVCAFLNQPVIGTGLGLAPLSGVVAHFLRTSKSPAKAEKQ